MSAESIGFDRTTAAIVRLQEKVDRLEQDFQDMKTELKEIKEMLTQMNGTLAQAKGWKDASIWWIGIISAIVSLLVSMASGTIHIGIQK